MRLHIPLPILMLLAAGSCGHWIAACCSLSGSATWNRLGGPLAAGGIAIDVTAFIRVRKARTTVNPLDPSEATRLATDRLFPIGAIRCAWGWWYFLIGWGSGGSASQWLVPPLLVMVLTVVPIIPEEQAPSRVSGRSIFRISEPWRGGSTAVGDARPLGCMALVNHCPTTDALIPHVSLRRP
jgi:hypothetical protein